ncbi:MAG: hypothetical protein IJX05_06095 [Clostridia bacterium]|nr:hypothetical protein [Clostridia bacterium]
MTENNQELTEVTASESEAVNKTAVKEVKHSGLSVILNKFFHHIDRGSTLKGEIMSGLTVFFLSICVIFMNVQLIASTLGVNVAVETAPEGPINIANATSIASIYIASVLVAFIGSLVIGLIARLPFVQVSMMGLGSSMLSFIGAGAGLTYYNLLFVSFISAIIYAVLVSVPVVRKFVFEALPAPVRKALPAALGLILAFIAIQLSGVVSVAYNQVGGSAMALPVLNTGSIMSGASSVTVIAFVACMIAMAIYFALRALKLKHPVFWAFVGGTLTFVLVMIIANGMETSNGDSFLNFGRLWVMISSQASEVTPFGDSYFSYMGEGFVSVFTNFGKVFSEGTQFAEGVNAGSFVISGVLCYLFLGMYDMQAVLTATEDNLNASADEFNKVDFGKEKDSRIALMCNAGMNVVAPMFGVGGVSSSLSVSATRDNGKSGLTAVVASLGFLVAIFVWAFPFLFATKTYVVDSMNAFNYNAYGNGGFIYCFNGLSFGIANAVIFLMGVTMLKSLSSVNFKEVSESAPAIVTVVASLVLTNLAYGVAFGVIVYCLTKLLSFRKNENEGWLASLKNNFLTGVKEISIPTAVLCVLMIVMLVTA